MPSQLAIDQEQIAAFCRRNRIRRLSHFGSVLRDDFGPASDVDILVESRAGYRPASPSSRWSKSWRPSSSARSIS
jgi:predicted nucleotidyltransferase